MEGGEVNYRNRKKFAVIISFEGGRELALRSLIGGFWQRLRD